MKSCVQSPITNSLPIHTGILTMVNARGSKPPILNNFSRHLPPSLALQMRSRWEAIQRLEEVVSSSRRVVTVDVPSSVPSHGATGRLEGSAQAAATRAHQAPRQAGSATKPLPPRRQTTQETKPAQNQPTGRHRTDLTWVVALPQQPNWSQQAWWLHLWTMCALIVESEPSHSVCTQRQGVTMRLSSVLKSVQMAVSRAGLD